MVLNLHITDVILPSWADRVRLPSHRVALCIKNLDMHVKDVNCLRFDRHGEYEGWPKFNTESDLARQELGHQCALYDAMSILLYIFPDAKIFTS